MTRMVIGEYSLSPTFIDDEPFRLVCDVCGGMIYDEREDDGRLGEIRYMVGLDEEGQDVTWHVGEQPEWDLTEVEEKVLS